MTMMSAIFRLNRNYITIFEYLNCVNNIDYCMFHSIGILDSAASLPYECASICSFCSRMKRGRIYACARREGYNVLSLGQHLDDLTER